MSNMLPRSEARKRIHNMLSDYVEQIGIANAAGCMEVSNDTVRRRLREEQPWFLDELLDLAYHQWQRDQRADLVHGLGHILEPRKGTSQAIRLPSDLRNMLRMVGRLTTEIADTLEDGRVDSEEAGRLNELLQELVPAADNLHHDLNNLIHSEGR